MLQPLIDLSKQLRLADVLDVAIVAALLYVAIVWFRDRGSRAMTVVIASLALLFLLARWLELYLTTMVFHYGLVGIVLSLVVVFQHDIRHGFERLAALRWWRRRSPGASAQELIDTLTESVAEMSRQRVGALIVLPGREPLDRHLRGGVSVDAKISKPLLLSIFNPQSPGHDGAVLVRGDRIAQLGLHLPLTMQVDRIGDSGTRHAAALGLAECCDAVVVVVSEERGSISIAQGGKLCVSETADLAECLQCYFAGQSADENSRSRRRWVDWVTAAAALLTATCLWLLFAYNTDTIQRTFVVPIEYRNLPEELEIMEPKPTYVELTLSGSQPAFSLLDPAVATVSLEVKQDVGKSGIGRWPTKPNLKNVPKELSVVKIVPDLIDVSIRPKLVSEPDGIPIDIPRDGP